MTLKTANSIVKLYGWSYVRATLWGFILTGSDTYSDSGYFETLAEAVAHARASGN